MNASLLAPMEPTRCYRTGRGTGTNPNRRAGRMVGSMIASVTIPTLLADQTDQAFDGELRAFWNRTF